MMMIAHDKGARVHGAADVEKAEHLGRRRARIFAVQAIFFIGWQGTFLSGQAGTSGIPGGLRLSAWLVWSIMLLFLLGTGGFFFRARKVRDLLEDELTRSHRMKAQVSGFWAAALVALALYAVQMVEPMTARDAIHIILSAAIGGGLLTFAILERRSRAIAE
jgi:hypothetical protein